MSAQTQVADARSAIESANRRFMDLFHRGDAAGVARLYTGSARLLPAHSDFVGGTGDIERFWQGAREMGLTDVVLETIELEEHGDTAIEVGRYTLKAADDTMADTGKYLVVWKREGGGWKLHRDIWTTSQPAA